MTTKRCLYNNRYKIKLTVYLFIYSFKPKTKPSRYNKYKRTSWKICMKMYKKKIKYIIKNDCNVLLQITTLR